LLGSYVLLMDWDSSTMGSYLSSWDDSGWLSHIVFAIPLFALALIPMKWAKFPLILWFGGGFLSAFALVTAHVSDFSNVSFQYTPLASELLSAAAVLFLSFGSDVVFVAATRVVLRWAFAATNFRKIMLVTSLNIGVGYLLVLLPAQWGGQWVPGESFLGDTLEFLATSNVLGVLMVTALVLVAVLLLANRLFWRVLQRPLYAVQRAGVLRRKKLLVILGFSLLTLAFPNNPIIKLIKDLSGALVGS
jgi:hypothetical protein